jgi:hypothetical protein
MQRDGTRQEQHHGSTDRYETQHEGSWAFHCLIRARRISRRKPALESGRGHVIIVKNRRFADLAQSNHEKTGEGQILSLSVGQIALIARWRFFPLTG